MAKVIMVSREFPGYHPQAGQPTNFVSKIWQSLYNCDIKVPSMVHPQLWRDLKYYHSSKDFYAKGHTVRKGRRWKDGDMASLRVWGNDVNPKSGRSGAYHSQQVIIAPDVKVKVFNLDIVDLGGVHCIRINGEPFGQFHPLAEGCKRLANNDGLTAIEFIQWFSNPNPVGEYQIICWDHAISY